ncbi:MAG: hypothetical protein NCA08_11135 [Deltaproteobacteria bacterium]|nr:hypothetical protein [Candidatus Deferrimicrobium borealis]
MNRGKLALLLVCYPVYFLLVVAGLMRLDIPRRLDAVFPNPRRVPYRLDEMFRKAEVFTQPVTHRRRASWEVADTITPRQAPSLMGIGRAEYFRSATFSEEEVVWNPDGRYETEYIHSVRKPLARLFLFGDSLLVSHDFKGIAYILNEELGVPTFRRTFGYPGAMETVYAFVNETPAEELRGKAIVVEISEGSGVWVNSQVNGAPVARTLGGLRGLVLYHAAVLLRAGDRFRDPAAPQPSDLAGARRVASCRTETGKEIREDPDHFNPVLYEYLGRCKALAFYDRDLAFATWDEPYFEGRTTKVSLENWLRRIGRRAREKGARFAVLYMPTKLSAYWPILRPILDYDKLYAFVSKSNRFNRTIRSHESLRGVLPRSIESWRTCVRELCREEGIGFIDLTVPYRAAVVRGEDVFREFDTHWNERGIRIAAEAVARFAEGGGS